MSRYDTNSRCRVCMAAARQTPLSDAVARRSCPFQMDFQQIAILVHGSACFISLGFIKGNRFIAYATCWDSRGNATGRQRRFRLEIAHGSSPHFFTDAIRGGRVRQRYPRNCSILLTLARHRSRLDLVSFTSFRRACPASVSCANDEFAGGPPMAREPRPNCWICGKPVSTDDAGIDEFGLPVHSACQRDYPKKVPSSIQEAITGHPARSTAFDRC